MSLEGQHVGRYHLLELLGSGGMGEVYLAVDTPVNRQVAIKVIRNEASPYPDSQATQEAARLFQREVRAIAGLDHPHILPLFDYGEETIRGVKTIYMVMPLRQEGTITAWLRQRGNAGLLSPLDIANIILQAASALQYAHDRQIVHQDVKPSNFLIRTNEEDPNRPYLQLSDFGVAKITSATSSASQSVRGTPAYMAPEQWEGNPLPATDQYALAVMAYELLTGRTPFQGGMGQVMYQHMSVQPQPPSTYNSHIPVAVDQVILLALEKKPQNRFRSISAFARAFQQAVQNIDEPTMLKIQQTMQAFTPPLASQKRSQSQDIHATLAISVEEALRGTTRTLTLSGGQRLFVSLPAGIHDGEVLRLNSQGKISTDVNADGAIVLTIAVKPSERPAPAFQPNAYERTVAASNPTPPFNLNSDGAVNNNRQSHTPTIRSDEAIFSLKQAQAPTFSSDGARSGQSHGTGSSRFPMGISLLLVALLILLIVGGGLYFVRANFGTGSTTNNNTGNNTSILVPAHGQTVTTIPTQAPTTAPTALPIPTATPTSPPPTLTATPTSPPIVTQSTSTNPYTSSGTLVLDDSLNNNSQGFVWTEGTNSNGAVCEFTSQGYHITQPKSGYFHACNAQSTNYANFVFEVQMTMYSGDYAGVVFRNNPANSSYYLFSVDPTGKYQLQLYDSGNPGGRVLSQGSVTPINFGQSYYLAVVANYANISLYVDRQQIASISDPTLSQGGVGLLVGNRGHSAEAFFRNARVWTL